MGSLAFVVEGTEEAGYVGATVPEVVASISRASLGSRQEVEREIDEMLTVVRNFWRLEPDMVMKQVAAYSARCTELFVHLQRIEGKDRTYSKIRTMQVNPLLDELDRQFRLASRLVEVRRQDLDTAKGFI
jgi:hypothetical protein